MFVATPKGVLEWATTEDGKRLRRCPLKADKVQRLDAADDVLFVDDYEFRKLDGSVCRPRLPHEEAGFTRCCWCDAAGNLIVGSGVDWTTTLYRARLGQEFDSEEGICGIWTIAMLIEIDRSGRHATWGLDDAIRGWPENGL